MEVLLGPVHHLLGIVFRVGAVENRLVWFEGFDSFGMEIVVGQYVIVITRVLQPPHQRQIGWKRPGESHGGQSVFRSHRDDRATPGRIAASSPIGVVVVCGQAEFVEFLELQILRGENRGVPGDRLCDGRLITQMLVRVGQIGESWHQQPYFGSGFVGADEKGDVVLDPPAPEPKGVNTATHFFRKFQATGCLPAAVGHGIIVEMHPPVGARGHVKTVCAFPVVACHQPHRPIDTFHVQPVRSSVDDLIADAFWRYPFGRIPVCHLAVGRGLPTPGQRFDGLSWERMVVDAGAIEFSVEQERGVFSPLLVPSGGCGQMEVSGVIGRGWYNFQRLFNPAVVLERHHGRYPGVPGVDPIDHMKFGTPATGAVTGGDKIPRIWQQRHFSRNLVDFLAVPDPESCMAGRVDPESVALVLLD